MSAVEEATQSMMQSYARSVSELDAHAARRAVAALEAAGRFEVVRE